MTKIEMLRILCGSHAHGLATKDSDKDFRSVYITPTSEILSLNCGSEKGNHWVEKQTDDNTSYEISHFLHLATKSNPSILEVFKAPIVIENSIILNEPCGTTLDQCPFGKTIHSLYFLWSKSKEGKLAVELRQLFQYVWSSQYVKDAFKGYSHQQNKRMFDEKAEFSRRKFKYATAHIRVLLQAIELLTTGDFSVKVKHSYLDDGLHLHLPARACKELENLKDDEMLNINVESWASYLFAVKSGLIDVGNIVSTAEYLKSELDKAYEENPSKETNLVPVNDFLLNVRKEYW